MLISPTEARQMLQELGAVDAEFVKQGISCTIKALFHQAKVQDAGHGFENTMYGAPAQEETSLVDYLPEDIMQAVGLGPAEPGDYFVTNPDSATDRKEWRVTRVVPMATFQLPVARVEVVGEVAPMAGYQE